MRKPVSAATTMRHKIRTAPDDAPRPRFKTQEEARAAYEVNKEWEAKRARPDHETIVRLALRIASAAQLASFRRYAASRLSPPSPMADQFEREASSLDSDVCQLCVEMQRACNGEPGPFSSDSWSHLDGK